MIPQKTIEAFVANLEMINRINGVNFIPRFRRDYIYIDITENMVASYYCRIKYEEDSDLLDVQFYDVEKSCFESGNVRIRKGDLRESLGLILINKKFF